WGGVCGSADLPRPGASWNAGGGRAFSPSPPLMMSLQRYLASAATDINLILGSPYEYRLRASQYAPKVKRFLLSQPEGKSLAGETAQAATIVPQEEVLMDKRTNSATKEEEDTLHFGGAVVPGVYLFELSENRSAGLAKGEGPQFRPEYRFLAYNIDAKTEGDLRRASRDDLQRVAGKETLIVHRGEDDDKITES